MKILVVEDEHRIASAIKKGLEQEKYAVDVAYDGEAGYDFASEGTYDLIIMDLMLPKIDGLTVCGRLRKLEIHTPILILTARGQVRDKVSGLDSGADDYLTKPFAFEELLARIRALKRRPQATVPEILMHGDLQLDITSFSVVRAGKLVVLTKKEFSLLEYLLRHKNQVVNKEQLINHVWSYDANILPNTVEVTIRNIRDKLERPFMEKKQVIKTVRGFGYRIGD